MTDIPHASCLQLHRHTHDTHTHTLLEVEDFALLLQTEGHEAVPRDGVEVIHVEGAAVARRDSTPALQHAIEAAARSAHCVASSDDGHGATSQVKPYRRQGPAAK